MEVVSENTFNDYPALAKWMLRLANAPNFLSLAEWSEFCAAVNDALTRASAPEMASLHPATASLVNRFAVALAEKLAAAERKYGYSDGWKRDDWQEECRAHLMEHVRKGDPRDVAAYAAFCWHHGWSTTPDASAPEMAEALEGLVRKMNAFDASDCNQADAYYYLVKSCYREWGAARAALAKARGQ